jgi:hypothetical protein
MEGLMAQPQLPATIAARPLPSPMEDAEVVAAALAIAARRPRGVVTTITMAVGAMLIGVATVLGLLHAPWFLLVAPAAFAATLMAAIVTVAHDAHTRLRTRGVDPTTERKLVAFAVACGGRVTVTGVAHALQIPMAAADAALCALASSAYVTVENDASSGVVVFVFPDVDAGLVPRGLER